MIAVDTSALVAILLSEPEADACIAALAQERERSISAATVVEASIVAMGRGIATEMHRLLDGVPFRVVPVTAESAARTAEAYARWGRGVHPARLNFGDCFAYELAKRYGCPLLYVGKDYAQTDIVSALDVA